MKRKWSFFLLLCSLFAGNAVADIARPAGLDPQPQHRDPYDWEARHEAVKLYNRTQNPEIVMIGDSITHHWGGEPSLGSACRAPESWAKVFGDKRVANMGFGFDYIDNAFYRVQNGEIESPTSPRVIIIQLGTNNLGHRHDSPQVCAENMNALLALLRERHAESRILLLSILPRREAELAKPIAATNRLYSQMADNEHVFFCDMTEALAAPGSSPDAPTANPAFFMDTVHPNRTGYEVIATELSEALSRLPNN